MRPALSVLFLTTLIGAAQGLVFGLVGCELAVTIAGQPIAPLQNFNIAGAALTLVLGALGLVASFFHLGHPERAWRAAARWRSSWLSREVIALPLFMASVFAYGVAHLLGSDATLAIGVLAAVLALVLFVCTGMIYAAVKAIREWATPLTVINYTVLGTASGLTLAAALAALTAPALAPALAVAALVATVLGLLGRSAALQRNAHVYDKPATTMQTAIGIRHPRIVQKSQGAMGGSFNTREFFHGATPRTMRQIVWGFMLGAFVVPAALLLSGSGTASAGLLGLAFVSQYLGLLAERWFFFAQAHHTQNLYYQAGS